MNLRDLLAVLLRRWYVLLAGLLVTTAACGLAFTTVPVDYEANASLLLLPPKSSVGARGNPYLSLSGLADTVDVLAVSLNADTGKQAIDEAHPQVKSEVGRDTSTNSPILVISTSGPSAAESLAVLNQIVSLVPDQLVSLQANVGVTAASSQITLREVAVDIQPDVNSKSRTRAVLALAGLGAVFTVLMARAFDRLFSHDAMTDRRSRKLQLSDAPAESLVSEADVPSPEAEVRRAYVPSPEAEVRRAYVPSPEAEVRRAYVPSPEAEVPSPEAEVRRAYVPSPEAEVRRAYVPSPEAEVPSPEAEVRRAYVPSPEAEVPSPEAEVPSPEAEVRRAYVPSPEAEVPSPEAEVRRAYVPSPEAEVPSPEAEVRRAYVPSPEAEVPSPEAEVRRAYVPSPEAEVPSPEAEVRRAYVPSPEATAAASAWPKPPWDKSADSGDQAGDGGDQEGAQKNEASSGDLVSSMSWTSDE